MSNSRFNNKIIICNFMLSILVIFIHSYNVEYFGNVPQLCKYIETFFSYSLGGVAVPSFFALSSYLFFRRYEPDKLWEKYKKRIQSVLIPYFLWNTIYFFIFFILTNNSVIKQLIATEIVSFSVRNFIESVLFRKYNLVFWFMQQLIYFIILTPIIYLIIKKKIGIIITIFLWLIGLQFPLVPDAIYGIRLDMMVYWLVGGMVALHTPEYMEERAGKKAVSKYLVAFLVILGIRFMLNVAVNLRSVEGLEALQKFFLLLNVLLLWRTLDIFSFNKKTFWWMEITFFYYAIHPLFTDVLKKLGAKFIPPTSIGVLALYFLGVGMCLVIIASMAKIMMKLIPGLWKLLNGGRIPQAAKKISS